MANVKITELTAATALAGTDVLPIVDVGADATKKVSVSDLLRNLPDGSAASPSLAFADDQNTGVLSPGDNSLAFATSGTQRLVIDSSGKVGIKNTNPGTQSSVARDLVIGTPGASNSAGISFCASTTGTGNIYFADSTSGAGASAGRISYDFSSDSLRFSTTASERLRIDSNGRVGVGTSLPGARLEVVGSDDANNLVVSSGNTDFAVYNDDTIGEVRLVAEDGSTNNNSKFLTLYTQASGASSPTERLRISSSGNARFTQSIRTTASNGSTIIGEFGRSSLFITGGSQDDLGIRTTGHMRFAAGGNTERMRIDSSGRLLVGTSTSRNSSAGFQMEAAGSVGNEAGRSMFLTYNAGAQSRSGFLTFAKTRGTAVGQNTAVISGDGLGEINFAGADGSSLITGASIGVAVDGTPGTNDMPGRLVFSTTADGASSPTERMRIDSSGRVGIGTTSPSQPLTVNGVARFENFIEFAGSISTPATAASIYRPADNNLAFGTASAERMRIDNSGRLLVGTTSTFGTGGLTIRPNITEGSPQIAFNRSSTTGTSFCQLFKNGGTDVGSISYTNTATAFNTSSDYRLKENVVDITDGITRVKQLQPRRFNFISDADTTVDGFVAHEAQAVVPEAVTGTHNEVDDDGNAVMQGIDQSKLVPLLTAALKEAIAKIETLETKVAALEAQ